jgi:hypothetical protein
VGDHTNEVRGSLDADDVGVLDGAAEAADAALFAGSQASERAREDPLEAWPVERDAAVAAQSDEFLQHQPDLAVFRTLTHKRGEGTISGVNRVAIRKRRYSPELVPPKPVLPLSESNEIVAGWVPVVAVPRKLAARGPPGAAAASGLPHERAGFVILGFPSQGCAPSTPSSRKEGECASH